MSPSIADDAADGGAADHQLSTISGHGELEAAVPTVFVIVGAEDIAAGLAYDHTVVSVALAAPLPLASLWCSGDVV